MITTTYKSINVGGQLYVMSYNDLRIEILLMNHDGKSVIDSAEKHYAYKIIIDGEKVGVMIIGIITTWFFAGDDLEQGYEGIHTRADEKSGEIVPLTCLDWINELRLDKSEVAH